MDTFDNFNYAYKFRQEALEKLRPKEKTHYVKKSSLIDLTGQKFGYLTALSKLPYDSRNNSRWLCKCDCGNTTKVISSALTRGVRTSCGAHTKLALKSLKDKFYIDDVAVGRIDSTKIKQSKRNITGVTGVWFRKQRKKYNAEIKINHVKTFLGSFKNA
ncbi:hypothetical protein [Companilactobacillus sp. FL22-1]|uniref:hypothetical protein n=1 Tax=Companilactobacillus sp. FL22-1 TaxID=3373892 RepID=UPI00375462C7